MITPAARLVTWANGTDLVIEIPLPRPPAAAWERLVDGSRAGDWFAPFALDGDTVTVDLGETSLGETELTGEILSCEEGEHVLVEFADFGIIGIQLLPVEVVPDLPIEAGPDAAALAATAGTPEGTVLVFTQSSADVESARRRAADFGPMWDTHLRMFARCLGVDVPAATEEDLLCTYADLDTDDGLSDPVLGDSATGGEDGREDGR